ncbi:hypothetical protein AB8O64_01080 [Streptomyces sp. QH1-20]|uniref:hypothetical protein n=1 Tax=Streptomyces sp. QH1-20 TaxID=3240934 RepID=UPI003510ECC3
MSVSPCHNFLGGKLRRSFVLVSAVVLSCAACSTDSAEKPRQPAETAAGPASSPSAGADSGQVVRAAATATAKSSARIDNKIEIRADGTNMALAVKGSLDIPGGTGRLTVNLSSQGEGKTVSLDEIFTGGTVYFRMPGEKNGDTAWRSVPRDKAESHYLLRSPVNDPEHVLQQVERMHSVSKAGEENVNGAPAVHYRGKLDHATLTLRMAEDRRAKFTEARDRLGSDLPAVADVWISRDGRIVRTRLDCPMGTAGITATMNLTDLGKPVETPAVPEDASAIPPNTVGGPLTG